MKADATKKEQAQEKRRQLVKISNILRGYVKQGKIPSINEGLITLYRQMYPEIREFNTFFQWKVKGYAVMKGAKSFVIWGQPRDSNGQLKNSEPTEEESKGEFYPLCYLFADTQVYPFGSSKDDDLEADDQTLTRILALVEPQKVNLNSF
jgi:hypothetical protein